MRRLLDLLYAAAAYLAGFFVLVILLLMTGQALFRALGWRTGGVVEAVAWLTAAAAGLALAHTFRNGDFVRVGLLLERLPAAARRPLELIALFIATAFTGYLAGWALAYSYESWQLGDMPTGELIVPLWIPHGTFALGTLLLFVAVVDDLITTLRGAQPAYRRALEERNRRGEFSEGL
jgi:TRAP-type C4-dicarboxylate transport system permease small subunit